MEEWCIMSNCKNCGAPIFYNTEECPYCKTAYYKRMINNELYEKLSENKHSKIEITSYGITITNFGESMSMRDVNGRLCVRRP